MNYVLRIPSVLMLVPCTAHHAAPKLNILFYTADDMHFDSRDVHGGPNTNLRPRLE